MPRDADRISLYIQGGVRMTRPRSHRILNSHSIIRWKSYASVGHIYYNKLCTENHHEEFQYRINNRAQNVTQRLTKDQDNCENDQ